MRRKDNTGEPSLYKPSVPIKCLVLGASGAGKTSLLRRYFHQNFENNCLSTIGSDFYSTRVEAPLDHDGKIRLQIWDTPGCQSIAIAHQRGRQQTAPSTLLPPVANKKASTALQNHHYASALGPDFFQNADAVMLVYDMTSSASFTQLMRWYADLMEMQSNFLRPFSTEEAVQEDGQNRRWKRSIPILIVANKLDLVQEQQQQPYRVPQRDVMGLGGRFRGNDFRYEYQVVHPSVPSTSSFLTTMPEQSIRSASSLPLAFPGLLSRRTSTCSTIDQSSFDGRSSSQLLTRSYSKDSTSSRLLAQPPKQQLAMRQPEEQGPHQHRRMEISSYLVVNREHWSNDWSYLASLLESEDASNPDRKMVLLWCMRNGLEHCETSAATGDGVENAVDTMIRLALAAKRRNQEAEDSDKDRSLILNPSTQPHTWEQLDLHQRYAPKGSKCFDVLNLKIAFRSVWGLFTS